jgi:hypothetical protein
MIVAAITQERQASQMFAGGRHDGCEDRDRRDVPRRNSLSLGAEVGGCGLNCRLIATFIFASRGMNRASECAHLEE